MNIQNNFNISNFQNKQYIEVLGLAWLIKLKNIYLKLFKTLLFY